MFGDTQLRYQMNKNCSPRITSLCMITSIYRWSWLRAGPELGPFFWRAGIMFDDWLLEYLCRIRYVNMCFFPHFFFLFLLLFLSVWFIKWHTSHPCWMRVPLIHRSRPNLWKGKLEYDGIWEIVGFPDLSCMFSNFFQIRILTSTKLRKVPVQHQMVSDCLLRWSIFFSWGPKIRADDQMRPKNWWFFVHVSFFFLEDFFVASFGMAVPKGLLPQVLWVGKCKLLLVKFNRMRLNFRKMSGQFQSDNKKRVKFQHLLVNFPNMLVKFHFLPANS